ncbi:MAG TPA: DUF488 family protein [Candidatus Ligilactobacillus excrementipullorum]|nr:DUF488 family protein [Candidatus Ligilactobacillus excrementipullorum]
MLQLQRIYAPDQDYQSYRILVDRLWPRGMSKEKAQLNDWVKTIAPSPELRKWFNHDPAKFADFRAAYLKELAENPTTVEFLKTTRAQLAQGSVTLLYGAKNEQYNQAVVLMEYLREHLSQAD